MSTASRDASIPVEDASAEAFLRVAGLTKTFRSGEQDLVVFSNMNLDIARGQRVAIIGESGTGKSTPALFAGRSKRFVCRRDLSKRFVLTGFRRRGRIHW